MNYTFNPEVFIPKSVEEYNWEYKHLAYSFLYVSRKNEGIVKVPFRDLLDFCKINYSNNQKRIDFRKNLISFCEYLQSHDFISDFYYNSTCGTIAFTFNVAEIKITGKYYRLYFPDYQEIRERCLTSKTLVNTSLVLSYIAIRREMTGRVGQVVPKDGFIFYTNKVAEAIDMTPKAVYQAIKILEKVSFIKSKLYRRYFPESNSFLTVWSIKYIYRKKSDADKVTDNQIF